MRAVSKESETQRPGRLRQIYSSEKDSKNDPPRKLCKFIQKPLLILDTAISSFIK